MLLIHCWMQSLDNIYIYIYHVLYGRKDGDDELSWVEMRWRWDTREIASISRLTSYNARSFKLSLSFSFILYSFIYTYSYIIYRFKCMRVSNIIFMSVCCIHAFWQLWRGSINLSSPLTFSHCFILCFCCCCFVRCLRPTRATDSKQAIVLSRARMTKRECK